MEKKDLFIKRKTGGMQTPELIVHQLKNGGELPLFHYPLLDETGIVRHCFTTRYGGVSEGMFSKLNLSFTRGDVKESVEENYRRIAEAMGVPYEKIVCSDQTHTTNVRVVTQADAGTGIIRPKDYTDVDGLITNVPEITLATFYADCVPLYFVDPVHHAIGLSHSGWRGTVGKIGKVTVENAHWKQCVENMAPRQQTYIVPLDLLSVRIVMRSVRMWRFSLRRHFPVMNQKSCSTKAMENIS